MRLFFKLAMVSLLMMLLMVGLTGCGSTEQALIGKWRMNGSGEIWEFKKDGVVTLSGTIFPANGVYSFVEDDQITITLDGLAASAGAQLYTVTIDDNKLTLRWHIGGQSAPLFLTKVEE